jgi:predicted GNAT family N-acyltransferase
MPQTQRKLASDTGSRTVQHGKLRLGQLDAAGAAKRLVMFTPSEEIISDLIAKARLSIPGMASVSEAIKVQRHNSNCIMALARKSKFDPAAPKGEGFIAMLPLNNVGMELLALDALDATKPNVKFLSKPDERPKGIYLWAIFAPGTGAAGMALFMEKLASEQYAGLDIYTRPVTAEGRKFLEVLGFTEGTEIGNTHASHLWIFSRKPKPPLYDSYVPGAAPNEIGVTIARTFEDLSRVIAVRGAVYIGEQECPYDEEFDGNDLSATHLLVYVGDEPAGCLRVRFFADFAKIERLVVRKEFRKTRAAFHVVRAGFKLCQKKGYRRVYGHSQLRLVNFWSRFGFRVMEGGKQFVFSDFDYVEIVADIERDPDAVTIGADPYVIIRPEGRWHVPGILEHSAARDVTHPSIKKKH